MTRCLTPPAVARILGVDPEVVHRLIKGGDLPAFSLSPEGTVRKRWKIDEAELVAFVKRRQSLQRPAAKPETKKPNPKPTAGRTWY